MIREAHSSDFRQCFGLVMEYLNESCVPSRELVAADVADHIEKDDKFFFVLEYCSQIHGILYGYIDHNVFTGERFARERIVYVSPKHRSLDILTDFVDALDNWAKRKQCDSTRVLAIGSENNEAFKRLLTGQRLGYEQIGYVLQKKYV